ncbi:hypothetical protein ACFLVN_02895 [Chloroflexota bacterium]
MRGAPAPLQYLPGDEGLRMFKKGENLLPNLLGDEVIRMFKKGFVIRPLYEILTREDEELFSHRV